MQVLLKYLTLLLISILSFMLAKKIIVFIQSKGYKKKIDIKGTSKKNFIQEQILKYNFIKTKEIFLSKQGYPLKLNIFKYYLLKVNLTLIFFIVASINYDYLIVRLLFALVGFFMVDVYIYANKKSRDDEIRQDLINIVDSICMQKTANISLKDAIKRQYLNCKNKDLRKAFIVLATKYELSELNIYEAMNELKSRFDVLEVDMFCNALIEYNSGGNVNNILENLSEMLKAKYMDKLNRGTNTKILYITFGVVIALFNIVVITFYPLFMDISGGFNNIFR